MGQLGIGIVGTGSIVNTYIKCIAELKGAQLIGLYTKSKDRAGEAKDQFRAQVFSEGPAFFEHPDINLICVCNESGLHGEAVKRSAEAGKHVLCEKPLEVTPQKIDEIIEVCKKHKVILGCVLQNRCSREYRATEKAVKEGRLGKLLMGNAYINWYRNQEYYARNPWRGTFKLDGGAAFMNQGIHTIDLLLHLMGSVKTVFGKVQTRVHAIEGEDVGMAMLHFTNGALGSITAGTALFPGYPERLEIYGEKGSILMEGGKIVHWNVPDVSAPTLPQTGMDGTGAADPTNIGHNNHRIVIEDMLIAMRENRSPMVDGVEARKAVEVITAIYRSSKEGKVVSL